MSLGPIVPILMIASTAISAVGAIAQGQAQAASYQSQAQASDYNAQVNEQNAQQVRLEASREEDDFRRKYRQFRGSQIASVAQAGIGFEGTGGDLIEESDINAEMDALSIRYEGEMRARQSLQQATLDRYDASASRLNAKSAKKAGYLAGTGALLSGGASTGSYVKQYGWGF